jgi:hypothetical protein
MQLRAQPMHVSPDLVPGHPAAVITMAVVLLADSLWSVGQDLVVGAAVLFLVNAVVTVIWSYRKRERVNGDLGSSIILRGVSYCAVGIGVVVLSNMTSLIGAEFRSFMFSGVAGVELLYSMHLVARMFERFRPVYVGLIDILDRATPIDFSKEEVEQAVNNNDTKGSS